MTTDEAIKVLQENIRISKDGGHPECVSLLIEYDDVKAMELVLAALADATARAERLQRERDRLRAVVQEIATVKRLGASMTEAVYGHRAQQYAAANLDAPSTGEGSEMATENERAALAEISRLARLLGESEGHIIAMRRVLSNVLDKLDYLQGLWSKEAITDRIAGDIRHILATVPDPLATPPTA